MNETRHTWNGVDDPRLEFTLKVADQTKTEDYFQEMPDNLQTTQTLWQDFEMQPIQKKNVGDIAVQTCIIKYNMRIIDVGNDNRDYTDEELLQLQYVLGKGSSTLYSYTA